MAQEKGLMSRGLERVYVAIPIASAQTFTGNIFIADKPYEVIGVQVVFSTANGAALTFDIAKCTGTQAPGSGTSVLASTFNMNSTANTVVKKTLGNGGLSATASARFLNSGDRLANVASGASTSLAGAIIEITLRPTGAKSSIY